MNKRIEYLENKLRTEEEEQELLYLYKKQSGQVD